MILIYLKLKLEFHKGLFRPIFSIYINDLINASHKFMYVMYADDTTISFNLEYFPLIFKEEAINRELDKLNIWLKLNKLTLNVAKTK